MPDYSKSVIYTIRSKDNLYVGSTINFRTRKNDHKKHIYNENSAKYNIKLYKTIRENSGEWDMQPYSQYPCNSKLELTIEEEKIRQLLKADMNSYSCGSGCATKKEYVELYREKNKDEIIKQMKQYREQNKDEINEKKRQKVTCECGCIVTRCGLYNHRRTKKHINLMKK